jgi:Uma2 family endonuclease
MLEPTVEPDQQPAATAYAPLVFHLQPVCDLSDEQVYELCQTNREWRIERTAERELIAMPPVGGETSEENAEVTRQLGNWAQRDGRGRVFDSSAGFILSDGAIRSPDAAWVATPRLAALTVQERKRFIPLCPDFVIEIRSPTDRLQPLQDKMHEYLSNGAQLGWLIDPENRYVYVHRADAPVVRLEAPEAVSGEPLLSGFALDLRAIWPR